MSADQRTGEAKSAVNPWTYAEASGRAYMTPEDITTAILAGADKRALMTCVLDAIGRGDVEDAKTCAFVATHGEPTTYERTSRSGPMVQGKT